MTQAFPAARRSAARNGLWLAFALTLVLLTCTSMTGWILRHPVGEGWDEAAYINRAYKDFYAHRTGGLTGLGKALLVNYRSKPSAFRIVVLPVTLLAGPSPLLLRLSSEFIFLLSLFFLYKTLSTLSNPSAGLLAICLLAVCPSVRVVCMRYFTEPALLLAFTATTCFLAKELIGKGTGLLNLFGLGGALCLGALSKLTFPWWPVPSSLRFFWESSAAFSRR
ncbi:glycosyltransferase family 39 protein [Thermodesulfobacteriota bacterium]